MFLLDFFFLEGGGVDEWKRMETQIIGKPFTLHSSSFPPHFLTVIFQTFVVMVGVQELGTFEKGTGKCHWVTTSFNCCHLLYTKKGQVKCFNQTEIYAH